MQSAAATGISGTSAVSSEGRSVQQKEKKRKENSKENIARKFRRKSCWRFVKSLQINYIYMCINDFLLLKNFEATKTHKHTYIYKERERERGIQTAGDIVIFAIRTH